jgi:nitroreductase
VGCVPRAEPKNKELLENITTFHPYAEMLTKAPLAILVCSDVSLAFNKEYAVIDACAATENLLIASHAKGLGAVWLGIYPREERINGIRKLLVFPDNILPVSLIAVGYPDEVKLSENRYKDLRIHHDAW